MSLCFGFDICKEWLPGWDLSGWYHSRNLLLRHTTVWGATNSDKIWNCKYCSKKLINISSFIPLCFRATLNPSTQSQSYQNPLMRHLFPSYSLYMHFRRFSRTQNINTTKLSSTTTSVNTHSTPNGLWCRYPPPLVLIFTAWRPTAKSNLHGMDRLRIKRFITVSPTGINKPWHDRPGVTESIQPMMLYNSFDPCWLHQGIITLSIMFYVSGLLYTLIRTD